MNWLPDPFLLSFAGFSPARRFFIYSTFAIRAGRAEFHDNPATGERDRSNLRLKILPLGEENNDRLTTRISRSHFRLLAGERETSIEDLQSTRGTSVNEEALQPGQPRVLRDKDVINAARSLELRYHEFRQVALAAGESGAEQAAASGPLLAVRLDRMHNLAGVHSYVIVRQEAVIGSAESAVIRIPEPWMGEHHAAIVNDGGKLCIVNLDPRRGVRLNDEEMALGEVRPLKPGARLKFGPVLASFQEISDEDWKQP
ncbi:MAG: hypothetical protein GMKNLPBB_02430 [Myxococcota bacterium]|nr:hypothetical protein [Myxococcota bacterium]